MTKEKLIYSGGDKMKIRSLINFIRRICGTQAILDRIDKNNSSIDHSKIEAATWEIGNLYAMCANYITSLQINNFLSYSQLANSGFGELQILCDKYGSDKGSVFAKGGVHPYYWMAHTFASVYELLFAPIRNEVKYVFECGIGTNNVDIPSNMTANANPGSSLFVWNEYFKSSIVNVYGADIDRGVLFAKDKIKTFYMDQTNKNSIDEYFKKIENIKFDIMIDDGLHTSSAAITLFENSIQYLTPNGIYFIEDMNQEFMVDLYGYFNNKEFNVNYIAMAREGAFDSNNLIVIKRKLSA